MTTENNRERDLLRAVLLFHSAGAWTNERRDEWARIIGGSATTKRLCDAIRATLENV